MSTFNIIILLFISYLNFYHKANAISKHHLTNTTKISWSWHHHICIPFWPFHCTSQGQTPPTPTPVSLAPPSPPSLLPPLLPLPPPSPSSLLPPLPPLPPLPTTLIFADLRLAIVYPIIQRFKSIITSDPLGITNTWVGSDICSYQGFFCDTPPDNASATAIASIDFNGYGLTAPSVDGFIDQLPDLALFHANSNNFGGTISPNIAKLKYLYELDLSNNQFTGPFPLAVVGMDSLSFLDIRFNQFFGSVPPTIFIQPDLEVLFLNDNNFLSTLPDNLETTHLLYLTLANNKFTGPIPRDINKILSGLTQVVLLNNQLIGCLPYELGLLYQVTVFDISSNLLTGPLPFSLACLQNAELLDFSSNLLYGMVPDMLCQLPNLVNLTLSNNYFTSVGPICMRLIRKGVVDLRNNCIPGLPSQRSMFECTTFFAVPRICNYSETYKLIPCKPPFH